MLGGKQRFTTILVRYVRPSILEIVVDEITHFGVDIDDGAVKICKFRLWLSMVTDLEAESHEVEPLPNIDFNIRQGNSLVGFINLVKITDDGDGALTNWGEGIGIGVRELYEDVINAIKRHQKPTSTTEAQNARQISE